MSAGIGNLGMGAPSSASGLTNATAETQLAAQNGITGFDPVWYAQNYPDVVAAKLDPLYHYLVYGQKEGRKKSADDTGQAAQQAQTANANPTPLNPSDPASMAAWRQTAHDQTNNINKLSGMLSPGTLATPSSNLSASTVAQMLNAFGLGDGTTVGANQRAVNGANPNATGNLGMGLAGNAALMPYLQQYGAMGA